MMILVNQKSKQYPKDDILSYKVIIIQKETIKKVSDGYIYDAYKFKSLNEYKSWLLEQKKNIEIQNLQQKNKQLEDRLSENEANIAVTNNTLNDLLSEVIPSLLAGI